jgi:hypothetical protein
MFRVFRLLPKLSHEAESCRMDVPGEGMAGHVQHVQTFAQNLLRNIEKTVAVLWVSFLQREDLES